uniref:Phosphoglycerate mutase-like protein n=1 Tax=Picea sitchensis TaxID=3332 RepID=A9NTT2_PICSI|nr:unknown [Picea sitchensis]
MAGGAFKNKYWVARHGRSIPNEKGLIVSSLANGVLPEYGLAAEGVLQAKAAAELFLKEIRKEGIPFEKVRIYLSPFSRTRQTAEAFTSLLNLPFDSPQIKVTEALRERYFGPRLELQSHDHYTEIWALDERDPFAPPEGGESVADVASRLSTILAMTEAECEGTTIDLKVYAAQQHLGGIPNTLAWFGYAILLVAHGDPLQIFQTILHATLDSHSCEKNGILDANLGAVMSAPILSQHRKFSLFTGELRRVM